MNDRTLTELAGFLDDDLIVQAAGTVGQREKTGKKRTLWKAALIAAALCMALIGTIVAVRPRLGKYRAFDTLEEAFSAAARDSRDVGDAAFGGISIKGEDGEVPDFEVPEPVNLEEQLPWYDEVVAYERGGPEDTWNEMYTVRNHKFSVLVPKYDQHTRYVADSLTGLAFLWPEDIPSLDFSLVEQDYRPVAGRALFWEQSSQDGVLLRCLGGAYQGGEGTVFTLSLYDTPGRSPQDVYVVSPQLEAYTTADGAQVTIDRRVTASGAQKCWVSLDCGEMQFSLYGQGLQTDELHTLLDSLGLSALME